MTLDEAVWVARKYLETRDEDRVGMLLSDEAVRAVCEALVAYADAGATAEQVALLEKRLADARGKK